MQKTPQKNRSNNSYLPAEKTNISKSRKDDGIDHLDRAHRETKTISLCLFCIVYPISIVESIVDWNFSINEFNSDSYGSFNKF